MDSERFERLKRRWGTDISRWPAPYRQEAEIFLAGESAGVPMDEAGEVDRLILEAVAVETDEAGLTRNVLRRIGHEELPAFPLFQALWQARPSTVAAALGFVLLAAGVSGYSLGGADHAYQDDILLAIAAGDPGLTGAGGGLPELGERLLEGRDLR